jgi:hypothetical protein
MGYYDTDCDSGNKEIYWELIRWIRLAQAWLHWYLQEQWREDDRWDIKLSETTLLQFQSTHKLLYPEDK